MAVRIGVGLSTLPDPLEAGSEAGATAAGGLEGAEADLAIVFLAGRPLAAPEATLEGVSEALGAEVLIGCGAGGVLARGRTMRIPGAADRPGGARHGEIGPVGGRSFLQGFTGTIGVLPQ